MKTKMVTQVLTQNILTLISGMSNNAVMIKYT